MRGGNQKRLPADGDLLLLETAMDMLSRNTLAAAEVDKVWRKLCNHHRGVSVHTEYLS